MCPVGSRAGGRRQHVMAGSWEKCFSFILHRWGMLGSAVTGISTPLSFPVHIEEAAVLEGKAYTLVWVFLHGKYCWFSAASDGCVDWQLLSNLMWSLLFKLWIFWPSPICQVSKVRRQLFSSAAGEDPWGPCAAGSKALLVMIHGGTSLSVISVGLSPILG